MRDYVASYIRMPQARKINDTQFRERLHDAECRKTIHLAASDRK